MKTIVRAENAGFCFGVKQAIEKAELAAEKMASAAKAAESGTPGRIFSMGPLIHNERVGGKSITANGDRMIMT